MSDTVDRLVYMANQIARNFAVHGDDAAVSATVRHMQDFWDPRMRAAIIEASTDRLNPIADRAVKMLASERQ